MTSYLATYRVKDESAREGTIVITVAAKDLVNAARLGADRMRTSGWKASELELTAVSKVGRIERLIESLS